MAICPRCQFENADGAATCTRCGQVRFGAATPAHGVAVLPTVVVVEGATRDTPPPGPVAGLAAPLPAPMVEPILTPNTPPPDSKLLASLPGLTLTLSLRGGKSSPATIADLPWPAHPPAPSSVTIPNRPTAVSNPTAVAIPLPPAPAPAVEPLTPPPSPPVLLAQPKLVVIRGQRVNAVYPVYEGRNTIGRFADKPVDIDLLSQEAEGQVWSSRLHAAVTFDKALVLIEDLNSLNGTWVNGVRIHAGSQRPLKPNDVIQIGNVQLRLVVG